MFAGGYRAKSPVFPSMRRMVNGVEQEEEKKKHNLAVNVMCGLYLVNEAADLGTVALKGNGQQQITKHTSKHTRKKKTRHKIRRYRRKRTSNGNDRHQL